MKLTPEQRTFSVWAPAHKTRKKALTGLQLQSGESILHNLINNLTVRTSWGHCNTCTDMVLSLDLSSGWDILGCSNIMVKPFTWARSSPFSLGLRGTNRVPPGQHMLISVVIRFEPESWNSQILPNLMGYRSFKNHCLDNQVFNLKHGICAEITSYGIDLGYLGLGLSGKCARKIYPSLRKWLTKLQRAIGELSTKI